MGSKVCQLGEALNLDQPAPQTPEFYLWNCEELDTQAVGQTD